MRKLVIVFVLLISGTTFSQNTTVISGKIFDIEMENEPIFFANVHLKDTPEVTQTNFYGNFEFKGVAPGEHTIVINFLGYEPKEIKVTVQNNETLRIESGLVSKKLEITGENLLDVTSAEKPRNSLTSQNDILK